MDQFCSTIFLHLITGVLISNTLQEEQLNVHLEPKYIKVCEGESVTLNCTFQPGGKYKVKLYYNLTPDLDCYSQTVRTREKWRINTGNTDPWSTFNIKSIKTNDSGWYFCKVTRDIPFLVQNCSDGIQVLVDANRSQEYPNQTDSRPDNQTQNPTTADLPAHFFSFPITTTGVLISNTLQEEQLNVHLEPKYIKVCEGESVTLNCTFQPGGKYKVKLYYNLTPDLDCYSPPVRTEKWRINTGNTDTWSTFNIKSIQTNDSGWYFCKVTRDIPFLEHKCSDGIQVVVNGTCRIMACI